jgi:catechol 2,3-dioxygenase-like lactoylglutathione lyase family enzyme
MIEGLSHVTFVCRDIERMGEILTGVLGAREVYASGEASHSVAPEKFFLAGDVWIAVVEGESLATRTYNHVAFKVRDEDLDGCLDRIRALGLDVKPPRPRVAGEGRSIYFHDDDNHLFELHTGTLAERLEAYATLAEAGR